LEIAKAVATLMMKDSNEKVGVDQVEFYSKLSVDAARELLEARLDTEDVSRVIATDHFQDSIDKLFRAKEVFVKHGANIETQTVTVLLAKFLPKAGRLSEARAEVDSQLSAAKGTGYLFNYAQLLYSDGQLNVYERKEQEGLRKSIEALEIYQKVEAEKYALYPLLLIAQLHIIADTNDLGFSRSIEGFRISHTYNHTAFISQFLQAAGRAATGLNKPHLAEVYLRNAVEICDKNEMWSYGAIAKATLAAVIAQEGKTREAIQLIEKAKFVDLSKNVDAKAEKYFLMQVFSYEGKVQGLSKNYVKSEEAYRNFIAISQEFGYIDPFGIGQIKKGLGEALLEQGRKPEAAKEFNAAKEEFEKVKEGMHPKNNNKYLDYSFSGKSIDELIKLVQP
ncbi:MAG: hypothetical protein JNN15_21025, partial [Blastocatellia bacterium]|nr:hypothetical protein [Blastocatellia bacterium]